MDWFFYRISELINVRDTIENYFILIQFKNERQILQAVKCHILRLY